jgi:NSS family neurotransmitter:Na+ symporter
VAGLPAVKYEAALDFMISVFGGVLLVLGGLLLALLLGWAVPRRLDDDLANCETPKGVRRWLRFMLRWVSPPVIAFGLIVSVVDLVQKWFVT